MQNADDLGENEFPPPEVMARKIRSSHLTYFLPPAWFATVAIFFAVDHEWLYSTAFLFSALIYLPISLLQYRQSKKICEDAIRNYRQWHQGNSADAGH